ncbi:MAG: DNA polymerase III subunit gamma/tau [Lachnospiraceae bacterium]
MAYQALYRKWRPKTFDDVRGQEAVVRTLKNQIKTGRIGHAYLFCGTRGTGKTSVAKIFARAVNCEHPVDGSPCGECASCRAIAQGSDMNVVEIDAASNNGVDNIRELRDQVRYRPTEGKYRVYIIDEVHMLSGAAFNALLKTLEEPPSYVIFILATTEIQKIPLTILSRCQRYDFHRIPTETIFDQLKTLVQKEKLSASDQALQYVARQADGSMRDALSLLDECLAFYIGKDLEYEDVLKILGAVDTEVHSKMLHCLLEYKTGEALSLLNEILLSGQEIPQFVSGFIWYLRNVLLVMTSADLDITADIVDMSEDNFRKLKDDAGKALESSGGRKDLAVSRIIRFIELFSDLYGKMTATTQKRVLTEVTLIRCTKPAMDKGAEDGVDAGGGNEQEMAALESRLAAMENALEQQQAAIEELKKRPAAPAAGAAKQADPNDEDSPVPYDLPDGDATAEYLIQNWDRVAEYLKAVQPTTIPYLTKGENEVIPTIGDGNELILNVPAGAVPEAVTSFTAPLNRIARGVKIKKEYRNEGSGEPVIPQPGMPIETADSDSGLV